ncbi:hypothetical protein BC939DRAFT_129220 [Gamsiella multidivaricata]|uniref:uncharacterized protein n=1 Tax=Gamsiella multidivaricata TaxID=101098 RepID=UPI00221E7461|nr:uncharacterized protein BC939DRAFT_129220 [Gamsiella multidivaricata]KAI7825381.1 hypothetical protein BC939DRAFT_129220 [Gamsiella multidivaricata]
MRDVPFLGARQVRNLSAHRDSVNLRLDRSTSIIYTRWYKANIASSAILSPLARICLCTCCRFGPGQDRMQFADARLKSFIQRGRSWPYKSSTHKAVPELLADAGFYWRPAATSPDNVVCFLCGKSLDGWTESDDPYDEHSSHSRTCGWAIVKTIPILDDDLPFRWDDAYELPKGQRMTKARMDTFGKWWPHERKKGWFGNMKRMAKAGFFYAPVDDSIDNVQCPYCMLALDGWEAEDDPVHEHQRRCPSCPFFATRAAAPTMASAAKATKIKRKDTSGSMDVLIAREQGLLLSPRSQKVHAPIMDMGDIRRVSFASRMLKSPATSSSVFQSNDSQDVGTLRPSTPTPASALKRSSKGENSSPPVRSVEFTLPEALAKDPTKVTEGNIVTKRKSQSSEPDVPLKLNQEIEVEEPEPAVGSFTSNPSMSADSSSITTPIEASTRPSRKRRPAGRADTESSTSSASSISSRQAKSLNVSVVITKKRKLTKEERALNRKNWGKTYTQDTEVGSIVSTPPVAISLERTLLGDENSNDDKDKEQHQNQKQQRERSTSNGSQLPGKRRRIRSIEIIEVSDSDAPVMKPTAEVQKDNQDEAEVVEVDTSHAQSDTDNAARMNYDEAAERLKTPEREPEDLVQDIENAKDAAVDYMNPVKRTSSSLDADDWEDEDHRESTQSRFSTPFLSPSKWAADGTLSSSTPNPKKTPSQPLPSITPRQKIKDIVGNAPHSSYLGSPAARKTTRGHLLSPKQKQQSLVDRLEDLMHGNDSSEVMAVAEHAIKEEVRALRRTQNKERKRVTTAAASQVVGEHSEVHRDQKYKSDQRDENPMSSEPEAISNKDIMQTPVKKASIMLLESTTPATSVRSPLPISKVISAIGAASRRNNNSPASPFVRTPVKRRIDLLRLEDLETGGSSIDRHNDQDQPSPPREMWDPKSDDNPFIEKPRTQSNASRIEPDGGKTHRSDVDTQVVKPPWQDEQARLLSGPQRALDEMPECSSKPQQDYDGKPVPTLRLHKDPEIDEKRLRLMKEANITESDLKMTVEEFHRHWTEEQVRLLELQAEAWIQRFQEECDRVKRALCDNGTM